MRFVVGLALAVPVLFLATVASAQGYRYPQAPPPPRQTSSTTILGQELVNADSDTDISVGRTRITSADPTRRDVIESRPEERRELHGERVSVAPLVGVGTNDFGFGLGARAGYTLDVPFYLGGTFLYHFGTTSETRTPALVESRTRFYYPAAEAGYDFGIGATLLRPYAGAGMLLSRTTTTTAGVEASDTDAALMVYPGLNVSYVFPRSPFYAGGDARLLLPLATHDASVSLFVTGGLTL